MISVVGKSESVKLDHLKVVENSPGVKLGSSVVCERVKICGLSRLRDVRKYSHVVKVRVLAGNVTGFGAKIEYCFHRWVELDCNSFGMTVLLFARVMLFVQFY